MKKSTIEDLKGKTLEKIEKGKEDRAYDYIKFVFKNETYKMMHEQECCEMVELIDICGDLNNLVGHPILQAEEVHSVISHSNPLHPQVVSCTWTFYKLATIKGSITLRWYGESNGCYSEKAEITKTENPQK